LSEQIFRVDRTNWHTASIRGDAALRPNGGRPHPHAPTTLSADESNGGLHPPIGADLRGALSILGLWRESRD
jgi:hypothetical protein